jgi:predicted acyltransferase (DUF342 family)
MSAQDNNLTSINPSLTDYTAQIPVASTPANESDQSKDVDKTYNLQKKKKAFYIIPGKEIIFGFMGGLILALAIIIVFLNFSFLPELSKTFLKSISDARNNWLAKYDTDKDGNISQEELLNLLTEEKNLSQEIIQETQDTANQNTTSTNSKTVINTNSNIVIHSPSNNSDLTNVEGDVNLQNVTATSLNIYNSYLDQAGNLYIGGTSYFNQDVTIRENINILGTSTFGDDVTIQKNLTVEGDSIFGDNVTIQENLTVEGSSTFEENVTFEKDVTINEDLTVEGDITTNTQINSPYFCDENGENCFTAQDLSGLKTSEILKTSANYSGNISYTGGLVGYQAANAICGAEFEGSHFCRTDEVIHVISAESISEFSGTGWIAEGPPGYTSESNDCNGYTSSSTSKLGAFWLYNSNGGGAGWLVNCSTQRPISCCR